MSQHVIYSILEAVRDGGLTPAEAMTRLKLEPFQDLGYAKVDHHRELRQGVAEVIYGAGKTPEQIIGIAEAMLRRGQKTILITRIVFLLYAEENQKALSDFSDDFFLHLDPGVFDSLYNRFHYNLFISSMPLISESLDITPRRWFRPITSIVTVTTALLFLTSRELRV